MVLWGIFISAFLIGFSGAMMPGPMLGVIIDGSLKKGWIAGPLTVLGHGILEFILIIIMTFGLKDFFVNPTVAGFIGLFGGAFLAWMGYGMIKSGINKSVSLESQRLEVYYFLVKKMNTNLPLNNQQISINRRFKKYIPVKNKFIVGHIAAFLWMSFSIYLSIPWVLDLADLVSLPISIFIITGLAYIPGYLNMFMVISLLLDRQPPFKNERPEKDITILIAARNEADKIENTLNYIAKQDYDGKIHVLLVDNGSTDRTAEKALDAAMRLNLDLVVLKEEKPGKFNALNKGLQHICTDLMITLDADTLLHKSAVRYLVARIESAPSDVCAVAGAVLVKNSRDNLLARIQEWDYFLGIASIKRMQGLYQGTLVAQGAYSIYKTEWIRKVGGWPDAIGEDIVLSWRLMVNNLRIYFEPYAVAFTEVPTSMSHFCKQRSRWARGMIEALKAVKPWQQPQLYVKYLTTIDLLLPYLDAVYTLCWLPGLIGAFFGYYYIVGPMTLFVVPLTLISYWILYEYQKNVFKNLDLKIRKNKVGFIIFVLFYQVIMSPVSFWGYIQEFIKLKRIWK